MEKQDIYLLNDKLEEECFQNVKNHFEATGFADWKSEYFRFTFFIQ